VTNAIRSSVTKLDHKIARLEIAVQEVEKKANQAKTQTKLQSGDDLFTAGLKSEAETRALASRLDGAIAKVEALLKQGETAHG